MITLPRHLSALMVTVVTLLFAGSTSGDYTIDWFSIDCGGGTTAGGGFELASSIGQFDGQDPNASGGFELQGGFQAVRKVSAACATDLDGNGSTGFDDLVNVLANWGPCGLPCVGDVDGDGTVGFSDLVTVLAAWGPCP